MPNLTVLFASEDYALCASKLLHYHTQFFIIGWNTNLVKKGKEPKFIWSNISPFTVHNR